MFPVVELPFTKQLSIVSVPKFETPPAIDPPSVGEALLLLILQLVKVAVPLFRIAPPADGPLTKLLTKFMVFVPLLSAPVRVSEVPSVPATWIIPPSAYLTVVSTFCPSKVIEEVVSVALTIKFPPLTLIIASFAKVLWRETVTFLPLGTSTVSLLEAV